MRGTDAWSCVELNSASRTWYQWWLDCENKHYNTGGDFGGGLF